LPLRLEDVLAQPCHGQIVGARLAGRELVNAFDDALNFPLLRFVFLLVVLALRKEPDRRRTHREDEKRKDATPLFHKA